MKELTKETEQETYNRSLLIWDGQEYFDLAKIYASERLKQSLPTEEEIKSLSHDWLKTSGYAEADRISYKLGFQDAIELLTKGEK